MMQRLLVTPFHMDGEKEVTVAPEVTEEEVAPTEATEATVEVVEEEEKGV